MGKIAVGSNSRISSLGSSVAQVVAYLLLLVLLRQLFLTVGLNDQDAAAVTSCIACLLCLVAYGVQQGSFDRSDADKGLGLWCAAFAGTLCIVAVSIGVAHLMGLESSVDPTVANVIGYGFAAPIAEEVLYRGIVINRIEQGYGSTFALFASSALFAVAHVQPVQVLLAFAFGLLLGFVYQRGRSLGMVVLMHVIANMLMFAITLWPSGFAGM